MLDDHATYDGSGCLIGTDGAVESKCHRIEEGLDEVQLRLGRCRFRTIGVQENAWHPVGQHGVPEAIDRMGKLGKD
ncbi:hypothetical protein D3C71_1202440 [compost metagenome]